MDEDAHARLLDALTASRCMVLISGYDSPLYAARLAGWRKLTKEVNAAAFECTKKTECLWINEAAWTRRETEQTTMEV